MSAAKPVKQASIFNFFKKVTPPPSEPAPVVSAASPPEANENEAPKLVSQNVEAPVVPVAKNENEPKQPKEKKPKIVVKKAETEEVHTQTVMTKFFQSSKPDSNQFHYLFQREEERLRLQKEEEERIRAEEEAELQRQLEEERRKKREQRLKRKEEQKRRFEQDQERRRIEEVKKYQGKCIVAPGSSNTFWGLSVTSFSSPSESQTSSSSKIPFIPLASYEGGTLFLGNRLAARNYDWFNETPVHCVLNVTQEVKNYFQSSSSSKKTASQETLSTPSERSVPQTSNTNTTKDLDSPLLLSPTGGPADPDVLDFIGQVLGDASDENLIGLGSSMVDDDDEESSHQETFKIASPAEKEEQSAITPIETKIDEDDEEGDDESDEDLDVGDHEMEDDEDKELMDEDDLEVISESSKLIMDAGNLNINYKRICIEDTSDTHIIEHFAEGCDFLADCLFNKRQNVLVHCREGLSRSPSMVIAFLMRHLGWNLERAYDHVHACNLNKLRINEGFKRQLMQFELDLFGVSSKDFFDGRRRDRRAH